METWNIEMAEKHKKRGGTSVMIYYKDQFNIHLEYSGKVTQEVLKSEEKLFAELHPESPIQRIFVSEIEGEFK